MIIDAIAALLILVLTTAIGLPSAVLLARRWSDVDAGELLAAAAGIGVLFVMLSGMALGHTPVYGVETVLAMQVVFAAATGAMAVSRRAGLDLPRVDAVSAGIAGAAVVAVVAAGPTSYFVFQTGDMGSYVNAANIVARGDGFGSGFPHGFTAWLGNANVLVGQASMVDAAMRALGGLLILSVAVLARSLSRSAVAAGVVAVVAIAHPVTRWFSSIPVSEALFAVLVSSGLLLLWKARRGSDPATAALAGLFMGSLLLVRANALVLVGVVVAAAVISAIVDDRARRRTQVAFGCATTAGLVLAYAYDVEFIPSYFVKLQLEVELPPAVFDLLETLDLLAITPSLLVAGVFAVGFVFAISWIHRLFGPKDRSEYQSWWAPAAGLTVVAATSAVSLAMGTESLFDALARWQVLVLVAALAGIALVAAGRVITDPVMVVVFLAIGALGLVLYAARLDEPLSHAYYLYWDRYLFGDSFVVALVLAGIAVAAAVRAVQTLDATKGRLAASVAAASLGVLLVAGSIPIAAESRRIEQHEFFGDSYGALEAIADLVPDDRSELVVYSGPPAPPEGWFFANLFRAYGLPLRQTFDVPTTNLPADAFAADPTASVAYARTLIARRGDERGFLLRVRAAEDVTPVLGTGATLLRTVVHPVWIMPRSIDGGDEEYRRVDIVLELYRVERVSAGSPRP